MAQAPVITGFSRRTRRSTAAIAAALLALFSAAGHAGPPPIETARPLARLPHDPSAFTEGLLISRGALYESTGDYGHSEVRRVDLASGRILARHALPDRYFGEGLARFDDRLYQLTWKSGTGFIYDADTLRPIGRFRYAGQGWGLTRCGGQLVMSNGSAILRFVDPSDFSVRRRLLVTEHGRPVMHLNELETIDGLIWANVWLTDDIVRIDPVDGHVVDRIDASALADAMPDSADVLNGIAYDAGPDRVYITGKYWPVLFRIARPPAPEAADQNASARARCQSRR
ncbi:glutaminyl-peptide cyclotransferase [Salinisphaera sp. RV14]|uniref:glutaminyl-peptide cyclotransferase n=1 Tax=unclassified Salinisphaera TaxID=2649847 RepID=UPI003F8282DF